MIILLAVVACRDEPPRRTIYDKWFEEGIADLERGMSMPDPPVIANPSDRTKDEARIMRGEKNGVLGLSIGTLGINACRKDVKPRPLDEWQSAIPHLNAILRGDFYDSVRSSAAHVLGCLRLDEDRQQPLVECLLHDDSVFVRAECAEALLATAHESHLALLMGRLGVDGPDATDLIIERALAAYGFRARLYLVDFVTKKPELAPNPKHHRLAVDHLIQYLVRTRDRFAADMLRLVLEVGDAETIELVIENAENRAELKYLDDMGSFDPELLDEAVLEHRGYLIQ